MYPAVQGRLAFRRAALFFLVAALACAQPEDLSKKSEHGKELMAAGRFAEAVPIYEEMCRALPNNAGLRLNLALALQMSGRQRDAIPIFQTVLKLEPNSLPALISLGAARLETGDPGQAIAPLQKAVALEPANIDTRGMLANALLALKRAKEASVHFHKLTSLAPEDPKAWYGLGRSYETLAAQAFDELSKTAESSAEWLALVADSRMARRQYRSAFYFYKQALEKKPGLRGLHAGIAEVYRATDHSAWAVTEQAKEATLPAPDCARNRSECAYVSGRFLEAASSPSPYWRARAYNELALRAFSRLGKLPESVELHTLQAEIAADHGQYLDAAREWRAALKLNPGDPRLERELATSLYLGRDYESVLPLLQRLLERDPKSAELQFFLGDSLLRLEQPEKALPYLESAVQLDSKLLPAQASLGLAYSRTGKAPGAIAHLEAALETDDDGSLHYALSRAYQSTGATEKAREAMAAYQKIQKQNEAGRRDLEDKVKITAP